MAVSEKKKMVSLRADKCQRICLAQTSPDPLWDTLKKKIEDTGKNRNIFGTCSLWISFTG